MRHFAITGIETAAIISRIFLGEAILATPPSARICAGTRSRAMTEVAPDFSAISACTASVTSIMTPPFSISARPVFKRRLVELFPLFCDILIPFPRSRRVGVVYALELLILQREGRSARKSTAIARPAAFLTKAKCRPAKHLLEALPKKIIHSRCSTHEWVGEFSSLIHMQPIPATLQT